LGLWKICLTRSGQSLCISLSCDNFKYDSSGQCTKMIFARSLITVACISSGIAALFLLMFLIQGANPKPGLLRLSKGFPFGSLLTAIIGTGTGIAFATYQSELSVSVAAILAIIAIIANLIGAITTTMISVDYYESYA
jgi:hypothetical protein